MFDGFTSPWITGGLRIPPMSRSISRRRLLKLGAAAATLLVIVVLNNLGTGGNARLTENELRRELGEPPRTNYLPEGNE